jgi:F-type H+-transporting ATPase subunit a
MPVFRVPTANLALTVGLALAVVVAANILAFSISPIRHIQQFIVIKPLLAARTPSAFGLAFIDFFLGFLNIISEFAKVFSLSFRLFGNIFAGEVMVAVIAGLSAYTHFIAPIPFVALSIFSGFIQAFVFVLLSIQYIAGSIAAVEQSDLKAA